MRPNRQTFLLADSGTPEMLNIRELRTDFFPASVTQQFISSSFHKRPAP
jgi:hypothetical protein